MPISGARTIRHTVPTTISLVIPFTAENSNCPPSMISASGEAIIFKSAKAVYRNFNCVSSLNGVSPPQHTR